MAACGGGGSAHNRAEVSAGADKTQARLCRASVKKSSTFLTK